MKTTFMAKNEEVKRQWFVVDAEGLVLGRLATKIAMTLMGKTKPEYTPHADSGDFVIVLNAEKIRLTGKKLNDKIYYSHSGYPGGITDINAKDLLATKPADVITLAVKGMLPRNRLAFKMLTRLKVYKGAEHNHEAQQPKVLL